MRSPSRHRAGFTKKCCGGDTITGQQVGNYANRGVDSTSPTGRGPRREASPGESPYKQIVHAATKAVVSGDLLPGSPFPSVRVLSQALKVNPNTAHKVIAELVRSDILEVLPGVGPVVAEWGPASPQEMRQLLSEDVERGPLTLAEVSSLDVPWVFAVQPDACGGREVDGRRRAHDHSRGAGGSVLLGGRAARSPTRAGRGLDALA